MIAILIVLPSKSVVSARTVRSNGGMVISVFCRSGLSAHFVWLRHGTDSSVHN